MMLSGVITMKASDPELSFNGTGTASDPYLLKNAADIVALANACGGESGATSGVNAGHYAGKHFVITDDIDMSGIAGFFGIGSAPAGSSSGISWHFDGIIDGQGHTVSNMLINGLSYDSNGTALAASKTGSRSYVGFVGTLGQGGAVRNLNFDSSCSVEGFTTSGTVVGQANAGSEISNCTSAATVSNIKKFSGGIVGIVNGSQAETTVVTDCAFTGTVRECTEGTGGIAGKAVRAIIRNCINLGNVEAQSFNAFAAKDKQNQGAGIVGYTQYNTTVENCLNAGQITVSYQKIGGIVAYNSSVDATVKACVNLGQLISPDKRYFGAIVGHNFKSGSGSGKISDCYYDSQIWGEINGYQVAEGCVTHLPTSVLTDGHPLNGLSADFWTFEEGFYPRLKSTTLSDMQKRAAATYVKFANGQNAADFITSAAVSNAMAGISASMRIGEWFSVQGNEIIAGNPVEAVSDTIILLNGPYRMCIPVSKVPVSFEGSGTESDPYIISSKKHLMTIADMCNSDRMEHYSGVHFLQTEDIDMDGDRTFKGIASKCTNAFNSEQSYYFSGVYDGGGHTISNLAIEGVTFRPDGTANEYTQGSAGNVGLFGALGPGALVKNLNITSSEISGYYNVGGISGFMHDNTEIRSCSVEAYIKAYNKAAGGITGASNASSDAVSITISGCIFRGKVLANSETAGGIIGLNHALVSNCMNIGDVAVSKFNDCVPMPKMILAGGIAGSNSGNIYDCFNAGNVSVEWSQAGGIAGYNTNGYRKGNIVRNVSVGQVSAADLTYAGSLIGLDYRINTSQASHMELSGNLYDKQVCQLGGSGNIDKEGLSGMPTETLTSGNAVDGLGENWSFMSGSYPLPTSLASVEAAKKAAVTYIAIDAPHSLFNFGEQASLASTMPLTATLTDPTGTFSIDGTLIKASVPTSVAEAEIVIRNGDLERNLKLTKTGYILPGQGTADSPYLISCAEDFNKAADFLRDNNFDFGGTYFLLTDDIDFNSTAIHPMGFSGTYFNGFFDGNGKRISGVHLDTAGQTDASAIGIFGYVGQGGTISGLTVENSSFSGESFVGAIAGHCMGKIITCHVGSDVTVTGSIMANPTGNSGNEIGGIAGRAYSSASLTDCINEATVSGNKMVGGIVGATQDDIGCIIYGCVNNGFVSGSAPRETSIQGGQEVSNYVETMVGGIAGRFTGKIDNCRNNGEIRSLVCNAVGGIVGKAFIHAEISGCVNTGNVATAYAYAGGIAGITSVTSGDEFHTIIDNCSNEGPIEGMSSIGGIAGVAANGCSITRSHNTAKINPMMGRAGGITGEISQKVYVSECYNTGEIMASMLAGGIAGDAPKNSQFTVSHCFNTGNVEAGSNGGAAGIVNATDGDTSISDCYNNADIRAARYVGGITGRSENVRIERCYSSGIVESTSSNDSFRNQTGNIAAYASSGTSVNNCCYLRRDTPLPADLDFPGAKALDNSEMSASSEILGADYVFNPVCLPMLSLFSGNDAAKANAVYFIFADNDNEGHLEHAMTLGSLEGTIWSASGLLSIEGDKALPTGDGEAWLTATAGKFSRTYSLKTVDVSGLADIESDGTLSVEYYTVSGIRAYHPRSGEIVIRVIMGRDGRRKAEPVVIR